MEVIIFLVIAALFASLIVVVAKISDRCKSKTRPNEEIRRELMHLAIKRANTKGDLK